VANEKVGIRIPANDLAIELASNGPITATSANLHGGKEPITIEIAKKQLGNEVSIYLDCGKLPGGKSTIYDIAKGKILREGIISEREILKALNGRNCI
jgi:L-threonylcarbamoyladenylate synthase